MDGCCILLTSFLEYLMVYNIVCDAWAVLLVIRTFNEDLQSVRVGDSRACNVQLPMGEERSWHVHSNLLDWKILDKYKY